MSQIVLTYLPGAKPNERIAVSLDQEAPQWGVLLRQQHWAAGIGWYDQKVLRLDARQWAAFRAIVSSAGAIPLSDPAEPPPTIPFSGPREPASRTYRKADQA